MFKKMQVFWDKGDSAGDPPKSDEAGLPEEQTDFMAWLSTQPEDVQKKYETHVGGLKSALVKERTAASAVLTLQKKVKEFTDKEEQARKDAMTAEEKLRNDLAQSQGTADQYRKDLLKLRLERKVEKAAIKLEFLDPEDALKFLTPEDLVMENDDFVGVEDAVAKIAKAKPHLLKATRPAGDGIGNHTGKGRKQADQEAAKPVAKVRI